MTPRCHCGTDPAGRRFGTRVVLTADGVQDRRLQPAEAEVESLLVQEGAREAERRGIAGGGLALDRRPAGEAQPEQGGHLVERLAGGVVERAAEDAEVERRGAVEQDRVPAADDEADAGEDVAPGRQSAGVDVAGDVVDADERHVQRQGEHLGGADADEQRADEAGRVMDGDAADVG